MSVLPLLADPPDRSLSFVSQLPMQAQQNKTSMRDLYRDRVSRCTVLRRAGRAVCSDDLRKPSAQALSTTAVRSVMAIVGTISHARLA